VTARGDIRVHDDPSGPAAEILAGCADRGGQIALTGGSTPKAAYEQAAAAGVDWSSATLWFGDERCVPPDDERSNYGMAKAALLDRITAAPPVVQRIEGERGPDEGADDYERRMHEVFGAGMPELDLVLLGLGSDGHCASLFPGQATLEETERLVVGVEEAGLEPFVPRVSLTLPVINAARNVVFLVAGEGKADAVTRAFAQEPGPHTPASLVAPADGDLIVLLDPAAASRL
jgi:6-phosphogluconolactonase